jgi:hypothetical protein
MKMSVGGRDVATMDAVFYSTVLLDDFSDRARGCWGESTAESRLFMLSE